MALSAKLVAFSLGTGAATTTVAVTGVGFTPKAIIFWWSGRTESTDTVGGASQKRGIGFVTGATSRRSIANHVVDAAATSDCNARADDTACILSIDDAANVDGAADLQSFDADGFTLVIDDQFPVDLRVHALCLGGSDLTNVGLFNITEPGATGNATHNGAGFQGDAFFFLSRGLRTTAVPSSNAFEEGLMLGAAHTSGQWTVAQESIGAQATMDTYAYANDAECVARYNPAGATVGRASFVGAAADGVTLNWLESNINDAILFCLALKGGQYKFGSGLTQTDTTTDIAVTGAGFAPVGGLVASACRAEDTQDAPTAHDQWSLGGFDSATSRGSQASLDQDNVADSVVTTAVEHDAVYANISAAEAIQGLMDVKSMDADGVTFIMDDADPSQAFFGYALFGSAAVTGKPTHFTHYHRQRRAA